MKNVKSILWSLKIGFHHAPISFIFFILTQIIRSTLVVYTTVLLGDIISEVQSILADKGELSQIIPTLILYGALNVVVWLAVEIQWRFKDDYLPIRTSVGTSKMLIKVSKYIPLRKYDDAVFCDQYDRFQDGIRSQPRFLLTWISIGTTIYSLILSCIALAELHFSFVILLVLFFIIEMLSVKSHSEIQNNVRKEITPFNRLADYLQTMFFGVYNRDTRLYGLKDQYIDQWAYNKRTVSEKSVSGNTKISNTKGRLYFLQNGLCPLVIIGMALFLIMRGVVPIGSIYTIWQLSRTTLSNSADTTNRIADCIVQCKHAKETYDFYIDIKKNSSINNTIIPLADNTAPALFVKDVDFSYLPEKKVLHSISLDVRKGEIIALLGENGSGKSTLIKLLLGIYTPNSGVVLVFGNDAGANEEYIRNHISVAFQDFCCYPFSLRENVGFGNISEISKDNNIIDCLKFAQADEILNRAKNIDRMLGRSIDNEGIELSGGEWQRLALARAYLGAKDIMIFDEPAAKLDPLAEEKQFANIIQYAKTHGKTLILVSHRVGFARMADKIVLLKEGRIIESGNHSQLMKANGEYKRMFDSQREMYATKEDVK
ncbi:MAG: ABC transporter ATP-binding protein [Clostridia bacterium]|nr:ABC transporter ATP-binding protein [Clostridia bacterium]